MYAISYCDGPPADRDMKLISVCNIYSMCQLRNSMLANSDHFIHFEANIGCYRWWPDIRSLRSASLGLLTVPESRSVLVPHLWSNLPLSVRSADSVPVFKSRLKAYFYRLAFSDSWLTYCVYGSMCICSHVHVCMLTGIHVFKCICWCRCLYMQIFY